MREFEVAGGSIVGKEHRRLNKNNQDAYEIVEDDDLVIATVCDGCSDALASEVGANLICRIFNARVRAELQNIMFVPSGDEIGLRYVVGGFLERIRQECIGDILNISGLLNANYLVGIKDFFLATIVSVIITREVAIVCCIGDGVIIINGEPYAIGPFPDNEPPYIAYGAVDPARIRVAKELYRFNVVKIMPVGELQSVLIGSDGVEDIIRNVSANIPGKEELVGPISQFWENGKMFSNEHLLGRKLNLMNTDTQKIIWGEKRVKKELGLLPDDTTIVVVRRKGGDSGDEDSLC
jgi:hypothetical protein